MNILKSENYIKFTGKDALSFVDSLISNSLDNEKLRPSYLLRPDGKINHWFFTCIKNKEISIYQESDELEKILESLMQYAIRVECDFLIEKVNQSLIGKIGNSEIKIVDEILDNAVSWEVYEIINEIPSRKIIKEGLLPNETKWLDDFVDFEKGCFLGQEQASRIKYRGNPRRVLITNENGLQEMSKI